MEATVALMEGMAFRATPGSGHALTIDAALEAGGTNAGPRPMELLLLGLGGCSGMDVISILRKMRQDVTGYEVRLQADRAVEHPRIFTAITMEHVVRGRGIAEDAVRRAVELSATRYCSAAAMLGKAATIRHRYRVVDEATGTELVGELGSDAASREATVAVAPGR